MSRDQSEVREVSEVVALDNVPLASQSSDDTVSSIGEHVDGEGESELPVDPPLVTAPCPLCGDDAPHFRDVAEVAYHACPTCDFIFADPVLLAKIDQGIATREYDEHYWAAELTSARQRSFGSSMARLAEALLYCTVPVERFIDIGTGPGYLLDAVARYLPHSAHCFYGVEKFPPLPQYRTKSDNYLVSDLADLGVTFQCGLCVEVLEHLTPAMASSIAQALAKVSEPGSLYLFNTGLTDYVRNEDPGYLDPYFRGHITCWSVAAARRVFEPFGFQVHALQGKSWAFIVEMPGSSPRTQLPMADRIWSPEVQNVNILASDEIGEVMHILGRESARAYS